MFLVPCRTLASQAPAVTIAPMNRLSRLIVRNLFFCLAAQFLIWLPVIQSATTGTGGIPLFEASLLASAGLVLLFGIHIGLEIRKSRRRDRDAARQQQSGQAQ